MELTADAIRSLPARTLRVVLECAGHRRAEFEPVPSGLPWRCGAVAEACWTGTSLARVLRKAGVPRGTLEVVIAAGDSGEVPGLPGARPFARGLPLDKALSEDVLLAWEHNGEPIPVRRGGPVRLIVPGWYATDSIKWPASIWFSPTPFEGYFEATDYRFQAPGDPAPGQRMTDLPVSSLITSPRDGVEASDAPVGIRGIAWGGDGGVAGVELQVDGGPWSPARLSPPRERYARTFWELSCRLAPGVHVLCSRATDRAGNTQPDVPPPNVRGYANNAVDRVEVTVAGPLPAAGLARAPE